MSALAGSLERAVVEGFAQQARAHGAELHKRAVQSRLNDPVAKELLATFDRQTRLYAARAGDCQNAGDHDGAKRWALEAMRTAENTRRVNEAIFS